MKTATKKDFTGQPPQFALGQVVATPGALEAITEAAQDCPHCGKRETNHLDDDMWECYDCGMAYRAEPQKLAARLIARHQRGDWGTVDAEDWASNDRSLVEGTRLLSAYTLPGETKIWIITEADRSSTTLLLPEEY